MRRKLATALVTLWVALTFTFVLIRQMPGDILHNWALQIQEQQKVPYEEARRMAAAILNYDPDEPLAEQYARYVGGLARGDLGTSLTYRIPVTTILAWCLPWTLFLTILSLAVSFTAGTALGLWVASRRRSWLDPALTFYATLTQAVPDFLIGVLLLVVFGVALGWFPLRGAYSLDGTPFALDVLRHAALPVLAFALPSVGGWALAMRASAVSVLGEDFLQVAQAKGLSPGRILVRYLGRNSILPLIAGLPAAFGSMLGGTMLIESVFGYPGVGYFLAQAVATRDYTLMQGLFLVFTAATVGGNLAAEWVSRRLDPRLR
ncbi:MAG: ABC transporter permease [Candidatus Eremiobacterota bacterium]